MSARPFQVDDLIVVDGVPGRIWWIDPQRADNHHGVAYIYFDGRDGDGTAVILTPDLTASMYQHRTLVLAEAPEPVGALTGEPHRSSSQAGLAAVKYGPTAPPAARPFQVGDRVRITDHNRHRVTPDAQHAFEGIVSRIDPPAAPESGHDFGPYLWADVEPFVNPSGATITATFCPLTDDLTAAADSEIGRSIELLEPAPTPALSEAPTPDHGPLAATLSDRTLAKVLSRPAYVPSIVMLDRDAAAQHLADEVEGLLSRFSEGLEIFLPVRQALADYRETIR